MYYATNMIESNPNINQSDLSNYDITFVDQTNAQGTNQKIVSYNVINSKTMKELNDLFDIHFRILIDALSDSFVLGITNLVDNQSSIFIIILIIFIFFIIAVYVIFYFKLVNFLSVKVK